MNLVFLYIIALLTSINSHADICKTISKNDEYNRSDIVILGQIVDKDGERFSIDIMEVFKGIKENTLGHKINGHIDEGLIHPNKGETWLFL